MHDVLRQTSSEPLLQLYLQPCADRQSVPLHLLTYDLLQMHNE